MDQWQTLIFLLCQAILFSVLSILNFLYFSTICTFFQRLLSSAPPVFLSLSVVCLYFAATNFFYSAVPLHYDMAQRIISAVTASNFFYSRIDEGFEGIEEPRIF
ncbi:hypothetical protein RIF29_13929 [Crotalaria pallida]|uniref:Uncharacterized protein n=1 Tax=Crotalaria pallida TaxID=3830 RepID=A0AAN9IB42_CROPI